MQKEAYTRYTSLDMYAWFAESTIQHGEPEGAARMQGELLEEQVQLARTKAGMGVASVTHTTWRQAACD